MAIFNGYSGSQGQSGGTDIAPIPSGGIIIWSGASNAVPDGWVLCDGTNGTPDLRGKFVLGSSTSHAVSTTGGSETVTLTVDQMPSHSHGFEQFNQSVGTSEYTGSSNVQVLKASMKSTTYTDATGSSQPHNNMPPYYTLAYIMKL